MNGQRQRHTRLPALRLDSEGREGFARRARRHESAFTVHEIVTAYPLLLALRTVIGAAFDEVKHCEQQHRTADRSPVLGRRVWVRFRSHRGGYRLAR